MAAILKLKMAAKDALEKKWNQLRFCSQGYNDAKNLGSTSIGNFALDYISPCTITQAPKTKTLIRIFYNYNLLIHKSGELQYGNCNPEQQKKFQWVSR